MTLTPSSPERRPSPPPSLSRSIPRAPVTSPAPSLSLPPRQRRPENLARRRCSPTTSQRSAHQRPPKRTRERARPPLRPRTWQRLHSSLSSLPHHPLHPNLKNASEIPRRPPPNLSPRSPFPCNRRRPTLAVKARRPSSPRKEGSEEQSRTPLKLLHLHLPQQTRQPPRSPAHLGRLHSVFRYKDLQHSSIGINLPNLVLWVGSMILWFLPAKMPRLLLLLPAKKPPSP